MENLFRFRFSPFRSPGVRPRSRYMFRTWIEIYGMIARVGRRSLCTTEREAASLVYPRPSRRARTIASRANVEGRVATVEAGKKLNGEREETCKNGGGKRLVRGRTMSYLRRIADRLQNRPDFLPDIPVEDPLENGRITSNRARGMRTRMRFSLRHLLGT